MIYKAVIIGSGPAGYTAAIRIAQLGGKVAIVEKDLVGGICTNWGCTPSKAMITSAKYAKYVREAGHYGINTGEVKIDFNRIAQRRDEIMQKSREEIRHLLDYWKVDLFQGLGEIVAPNEVKVSPYENPNMDLTNTKGESPYQTGYQQVSTETILQTENIIIATGSEPLVPGPLQKEDPSIINSNKLIWLKDLPEELTIVGGGIIGLEFSALFSQFGVKIRIIEFLDRCLANMDPDISMAITEELEGLGIEILTGHKVLDIDNGMIKVEIVATGEVKEIASSKTLIAIGRKAIINEEELTRLGISHTPKGITVNNTMQTSLNNIYAVGDATGLSILAHVAIEQGLVAAETIIGRERQIDYSIIPAVVYTLPEVATVGTVPEDLSGVKVVKFPFKANLRANIEEHNKGFVKLWVNSETRKLYAAQLIGDYVGEIIQAYADIIALEVDLDKVARIIHAHPTYNEIVRNSLEFALDRAIEFLPQD